MNYTEFIQSVAARPKVPPGQAEPITRATLDVGRRITGGQARDLPGQLPELLRQLVDKVPVPLRAGRLTKGIQHGLCSVGGHLAARPRAADSAA
ncbi:DUF2267 domain-containing protein [Micromonospora sp. CPCC 205711]|uniref:DUF2267 domain-containing protein n=1 Tax=Micromonospora sp. CPCC 205547 TaxID=3122400 RepID=UPI002FEE7F31